MQVPFDRVSRETQRTKPQNNGAVLPKTKHYRYLETNRRAKLRFAQKYYGQKRKEIIKLLGGKCVRCGFSDIRALQIDHINGGGTKENHAYGPQRYQFFLDKKCEGLQLLCANCNTIKRYENKEFPFKKQNPCQEVLL